MAKKKTAPAKRRRPAARKSTRTTRRRVKQAGFGLSPMTMITGIAGAFAAPLLLNRIPVEDARVRNGIGAAAGFLGAKFASKNMPELVPAFVGFGIASGVMLAADLFPELGKMLPPASGGAKGKGIGRLTQPELDRIRAAVKGRMNGSGMPVIQGMGVPVINGLPDMEQFT